MAHRLPYHDGLCKNLHGHSYHATVEVYGETDDGGMVIDFKDIAEAAGPLVKQLDHSCAIDPSDVELKQFLTERGMKMFELESYSTAENIAGLLLEHVCLIVNGPRIHEVRVRVCETCTSAAEVVWSRDA
jgi:6-pyruvoyltetrahydropterin/6-carboxytetrahydropterin synthase